MNEEISGVKILAVATVILLVLTIILGRYHGVSQQITPAPSTPAVIESSPLPLSTPLASPAQIINTPKSPTFTNNYFTLNYPESWTTKVVPTAGTLLTWQAIAANSSVQVIVRHASYSYQSYQYHVSSISSTAKKGEVYSSITETKISETTALSYIKTTQAGEYTQVVWLEKAGLEYMITWKVIASDAVTRDQLVSANQDGFESLLRSFVLP